MKKSCFLIMVFVLLVGLTIQPLYMLTAYAQGPDDTGDALDIARRFLREHHEDYSLKSDLTDLQVLQVVPSLGADHVRFQQTYQGIPVYGAYVSVHIDKARKSSPQVTSRYIPGIQVPTTKTEVTEETAIEIAEEAVGVSGQLRGDIIFELLVYPKGHKYPLAWQVKIFASEPLGDWEVFVDALDGTVLDKFNRIRIEGPSLQGEKEKGKTSIKTKGPAQIVRHYFGPSKVGPTDGPKSGDDEEIGALDWTTIWSDGFEGAFPGPWNVFDDDGTTNGEYYWDDDPYRPHTGGWEACPANGGADALTPPANYPNYADSWMVYGPFDLSDAADAELVFYYWSITESGYDYFFWGASINGANFYGTQISGNYSDGTAGNNFYLENFDLTNVPTLGNLAGQSQVWIAFVFQSDYSITYEGTYVDDVVIRKDSDSCEGDPNTGYVFNPNPVVTSGDTSLVDNGNADSATLTAERQLVNLLGLDGSGQLKGPYVDLTAPGITGGYKSAGQANEPGCLYYDYTRSDDRFEEVTIYYHIDSLQRYIQSLGFNNVNNRAIPVHAHYSADDQSFYSPGGDLGLHFGDGGVDDGEDADIILHEYGHSIQDNQVPGWGATNEGGAMGEGFGDYLPASFFASANGGFNRECVGDWDATWYNSGDNPPCLRRVDGTKHYPEDMQGQVHEDGEIWSAALWDLWLALDQEVTDRLVIESHFYLDPMSQFEDGANAILSADQNLYGGSHSGTICNVFSNRGILDQCEEPGPAVDVYLIVDLTGSFTDDLPVFKAQAPRIISTLKASYPDIRFGLGKFEDYPIYPFGSATLGDKAYERLVDLTFDTNLVLNAINGLNTQSGKGWDTPESQLPALYQAATGAGQDLSGVGYPGASISPGQQANFRPEAIKIILLWTDAPFHRPGDPGDIPYPGPSFGETVGAIRALNGSKVIGIFSSIGLTGLSNSQGVLEPLSVSNGRSDLKSIAAATGGLAPADGVDCDGNGTIDLAPGQPLVCSIGSSGEGIGEAIIALVEAGTKPSVFTIHLPIILKNF